MNENIIELFPKPLEEKKCSFCGQPVKKCNFIEVVDTNKCICYSCVGLATKKLEESYVKTT